MGSHHSLELISDLAQVDQLLEWFNSLCPATVPSSDWLGLQLALVEAFTNAVRHAHRDRPQETPIHIELWVSDQEVELHLWDWGQPFDLESRIRALPHKIAPDSEGGRGLKLLANIADELHYERMTDGRNRLTLRKNL
ncbi:ATP-binding protein [Candidatus Synechococcus calcipolaris G9]|uniref:ATP-binding protein n=1 Tax=Candidatus Synechococcus calcipolaris G9 TaxID=1497997 RepID=A0ABT6EV46_9SYNE|nr:ATP-binding protein [Candidatus Synechococcus calcipolaris]MDG2989678.1 ATP-binding protein [Candidatus Synechococcus calcipolaris G9]